MHSQLIHYLTSNKLFPSQQYSFWANTSTELAALELINGSKHRKHKQEPYPYKYMC